MISEWITAILVGLIAGCLFCMFKEESDKEK